MSAMNVQTNNNNDNNFTSTCSKRKLNDAIMNACLAILNRNASDENMDKYPDDVYLKQVDFLVPAKDRRKTSGKSKSVKTKDESGVVSVKTVAKNLRKPLSIHEDLKNAFACIFNRCVNEVNAAIKSNENLTNSSTNEINDKITEYLLRSESDGTMMYSLVLNCIANFNSTEVTTQIADTLPAIQNLHQHFVGEVNKLIGNMTVTMEVVKSFMMFVKAFSAFVTNVHIWALAKPNKAGEYDSPAKTLNVGVMLGFLSIHRSLCVDSEKFVPATYIKEIEEFVDNEIEIKKEKKRLAALAPKKPKTTKSKVTDEMKQKAIAAAGIVTEPEEPEEPEEEPEEPEEHDEPEEEPEAKPARRRRR